MRLRQLRRPAIKLIEMLEGRCLLAVTNLQIANQFLNSPPIEGQAFSGLVATFTSNDPSPQDPGNYSATIVWGDGAVTGGSVTADPNVAGQFDVNGANTYLEEGTYPVSVTVSDSVDGTSSSTPDTTVDVPDAPLAATPRTVHPTEGAAFTDIIATFTDADPNGTVSDYTATIDWGDGHTSFGTVTANSSGGFNVTGTNTYAKPGSFPVMVVINDVGGSSATANSTAIVADAPLLTVPTAIAATEGRPLTNVPVATFTDAGGAGPVSDYTVTINWGDNSPLDTTTGTVNSANGNFTVTGSHTYAEEGSFSVVVTISDEPNGTSRSVATVVDAATVADAPLSATPAGPVAATAGTPLAVSPVATFTDADPNGIVRDYTATIDWGDGTAETHGTVTASGSIFTVSGGHTFASPGTFNGTVTVRDAGGSVAHTAFTSTVSNVALTVVPVTAPEEVPLTNVTVATIQSGGGPNPIAGLYRQRSTGATTLCHLPAPSSAAARP